MKLRLLSLSLSLLIAPLTTKAQQYTIPAAVVPSVNHTFNSQFKFGNDSLVGSTTANPPSSVAAANFTANLAAVNTISWTISAPAGYKFVLQQPTGASSANVNFGGGWIDSNSGGTLNSAQSVQVTMQSGSGAFTSNNLQFNLEGNADNIGFVGSLGVSAAPISFTSLTLTADISNITSRAGWTQENYVGNQTSPGFGAASFSGQEFASSSSDPGAVVTLVAIVPEPSTMVALLTCALGLVAFAAWRSARRVRML